MTDKEKIAMLTATLEVTRDMLVTHETYSAKELLKLMNQVNHEIIDPALDSVYGHSLTKDL